MQNALQKWIRESDKQTTDELFLILGTFGIYAKRHPEYNNLVQFAYDQIESYAYRHLSVTQISRGIILDENDNWNVICYPFNRFFNIGEGAAADIDAETMRVYEKVDGSLLTAYNYNGVWCVCTRNSPNAGGTVGDNPFTFGELFWSTFLKMGFTFSDLDIGCSYMFELVTPENMVVCSHVDSKLILLGVRNNETQEEYFPGLFQHLNPVREFPLKTFEDVVKASEELDPIEQEGYVICDGYFNRIKVKSPKYVALHHMISDFSIRNCIRLIKMGEESELFAYYPQYKDKYHVVKKKVEDYISQIESDKRWVDYNMDVNGLTTQKDFAELALKTRNSGILFAIRKGEYPDVRTAFLDKHENKIEDLLSL